MSPGSCLVFLAGLWLIEVFAYRTSHSRPQAAPLQLVRTILEAAGTSKTITSVRLIFCALPTQRKADEFGSNHQSNPASEDGAANFQIASNLGGRGENFGRILPRSL